VKVLLHATLRAQWHLYLMMQKGLREDVAVQKMQDAVQQHL
jgi:hypothetical protein